MLKIAVCDSDKNDRNTAVSHLMNIEEKWQTDFDIEFFKDSYETVTNAENGCYDVIIMDISRDTELYLSAAKYICKISSSTMIIFTSSVKVDLKRLFGIGVLAYLDKPLKVSELECAILRAYNHIIAENDKIFIYNQNRIRKFVYLKDILYAESFNNHVEIITLNEVIVINETLRNIWKSLSKNEAFIMPNRSYIVNVKYVKVINTTMLVIPKMNNFEITISRVQKDECRKKYLAYIQRHGL